MDKQPGQLSRWELLLIEHEQLRKARQRAMADQQKGQTRVVVEIFENGAWTLYDVGKVKLPFEGEVTE
jgi:hypothetical protein